LILFGNLKGLFKEVFYTGRVGKRLELILFDYKRKLCKISGKLLNCTWNRLKMTGCSVQMRDDPDNNINFPAS